jgi:hypothetical protein
MLLRRLAHARAGDKGETLNIAVIAYHQQDYARLLEQLSAERVRDHLQGLARGEVTRYALPRIGALNFVLQQALAGGVTRSLALDAHGKALSSALLSLELPD